MSLMIRKSTPRSIACHNDYLSENFINDGKRIWIIDWEYGGIEDPYFDLGDFALERPFTTEQEELIVQEYCGKTIKSRFYRMLLYNKETGCAHLPVPGGIPTGPKCGGVRMIARRS
jgi:thiamine kinase-like enzyme